MPRGAVTCRRRQHTACCHKDYFTTSCQSRLAFPLSLIIWKSKFRAFLNSGLSEQGGGEQKGYMPFQILDDQLTLSQSWGADYAHHITTCPPPPGFSNFPKALFLLRLHLHLTNPIFLAQGSLVLLSCVPLLFCAFLILLLLHACSFCSMAPNPWSSLNPSQ